MLGKEKFYSPIERKYVWFAIYDDDSEIIESDEDAPNFNDLPKEGIKEFGFQGLGTRVSMTNHGTMCIRTMDKKIAEYEFVLILTKDGFGNALLDTYKLIDLTGDVGHDWFQFKKMVSDNYHGTTNSATTEFIFGLTSGVDIRNDIYISTQIKCIISLDKDNPGITNLVTVYPIQTDPQEGIIYVRNLLNEEPFIELGNISFVTKVLSTFKIQMPSTRK